MIEFSRERRSVIMSTSQCSQMLMLPWNYTHYSLLHLCIHETSWAFMRLLEHYGQPSTIISMACWSNYYKKYLDFLTNFHKNNHKLSQTVVIKILTIYFDMGPRQLKIEYFQRLEIFTLVEISIIVHLMSESDLRKN